MIHLKEQKIRRSDLKQLQLDLLIYLASTVGNSEIVKLFLEKYNIKFEKE